MTKRETDFVPYDVEPFDFRSAMRNVAGAVSAITASEGGSRAGLTATSLTALSADPPTVLVCVNRGASAWPVISQAKHFAVNVLPARNRSIADRFAGRDGINGEARFDEGVWTQLATGAPVLHGALAILDCEIEEMIDRYSHTIVIGRVKAICESRTDDALLYWRGDYGKFDETLQHGAGI